MRSASCGGVCWESMPSSSKSSTTTTSPAFPSPAALGWNGDRFGFCPEASHPAVASDARPDGDGLLNTYPGFVIDVTADLHPTRPLGRRISCLSASQGSEQRQALSRCAGRIARAASDHYCNSGVSNASRQVGYVRAGRADPASGEWPQPLADGPGDRRQWGEAPQRSAGSRNGLRGALSDQGQSAC